MALKRQNVITLGSGKLYLVEYDGTNFPDTQTEARALCVDGNHLGYIKGGATLSYEAESTTVRDDLGYVVKVITTQEDVTFKSGIMTWNGSVISKLIATCRVTDDATTGWRTVKIGGIGNDNRKSYVLVFIYEDSEEGDLLIAIRGKNKGSFELTFSPDDPTVVDAEFQALAADNDGTLVYLFEEIGTE